MCLYRVCTYILFPHLACRIQEVGKTKKMTLSVSHHLKHLDFVLKIVSFYSCCSFSCPGAGVKATDHPRLALGSHIAAELREAIHCKLGLTGCAGIATNKLLAKLVSGTFKPNQQTSLLPENISDIMGCLSSLRKVPGI